MRVAVRPIVFIGFLCFGFVLVCALLLIYREVSLFGFVFFHGFRVADAPFSPCMFPPLCWRKNLSVAVAIGLFELFLVWPRKAASLRLSECVLNIWTPFSLQKIISPSACSSVPRSTFVPLSFFFPAMAPAGGLQESTLVAVRPLLVAVSDPLRTRSLSTSPHTRCLGNPLVSPGHEFPKGIYSPAPWNLPSPMVPHWPLCPAILERLKVIIGTPFL